MLAVLRPATAAHEELDRAEIAARVARASFAEEPLALPPRAAAYGYLGAAVVTGCAVLAGVVLFGPL